jgi:4-aminobutyrate aminotransferase/(S)-3-amino-2-methylpropionate transaminase
MTSSSAFGTLLPHLRVAPPGPASRALADRLRAVESRNVTHLARDWPIFWTEAVGSNVRDADGNVYVDLSAGFGVALLGHSHPAVVDAVTEQARKLVHGMGDVHPPEIRVRLLERLCGVAPWQGAKAVLASTGSEAVEVALKTAQLATGKPGVLAFSSGYHGLTLGSLAATEREDFRRPFARRLYPGVAFLPFPVARSRRTGSRRLEIDKTTSDETLGLVREALHHGAPNGDPIGAVLVEPVQGRAGARLAPAGFMASLSALARQAGAIVIADEILTGMGRCGTMLASERVGLEPDLVCVGKALGGGLPLSACLGSPSVMDAWPTSRGEALHTSTFLGHPLACAAALAALDRYVPERVLERVDALGERLLEGLSERLSSVGGVADVRGLGLLLGVDLGESGAGARVAMAALRRGLIVLPAGDHGQVVEITPAVTLTNEQLDGAVDALAGAIGEVV